MRRWNRPAFFSACVMCLVLLAPASSEAGPRSTQDGLDARRVGKVRICGLRRSGAPAPTFATDGGFNLSGKGLNDPVLVAGFAKATKRRRAAVSR